LRANDVFFDRPNIPSRQTSAWSLATIQTI
jgi:hypothetical protein